tara:strand:- start:1888 stop:2238 length:351 start_codon:yes stop_codon:yes gene_type:complete
MKSLIILFLSTFSFSFAKANCEAQKRAEYTIEVLEQYAYPSARMNQAIDFAKRGLDRGEFCEHFYAVYFCTSLENASIKAVDEESEDIVWGAIHAYGELFSPHFGFKCDLVNKELD